MRIGLSISPEALRLVKLGRNKLLAHAEIPIPKHVFNHGVVNDPKTLADALKELKDKYGLESVNATFPHRRGYIFTTTLKKSKDESLDNAVAAAVEENIHTPRTRVHFDYKVIEEGEDWAEVSIAVHPRPLINTYKEIFKNAGIKADFHLEPQALATSVLPHTDHRPYVIAWIGEHVDVFVFERGVVQSHTYSTVENAGKDIRKIVAFWNTSLDKYGLPRNKIEKVYLVGNLAHEIDESVGELGDSWQNLHYKPVSEMPFNTSLSYAAAVGAALSQRKSPWWKRSNKLGYF